MKTQLRTAVVITAKDGQVFFPNAAKGKDGEIYGYVRFQQDEISLVNKVHTTKERSILQQVHEKVGKIYKAGMELPGNIVFTDSEKPSFEGQEPLQVPMRDENNKETGDLRVVTSNKKPVYRTYEYDATGVKTDFKMDYDEVEEVEAEGAAAGEKAVATKLS